jgi:hypothetical protein
VIRVNHANAAKALGLNALSPMQSIRRGAFRSVKELVARIEAFIAAWSAGASPFVWTKTDDEILAKAVRKRPATNEPRHQVRRS